jgi:predicted N-formylglutamate amidohydrolase
LLTCEHGGNLIPADLAERFRGRERLLHSHRGWDPGALELAGHLAVSLRAPLRFALVSRLVVDLNRSLDNPTLLSKITEQLDGPSRAQVLRRHYHPYRREVDGAVERMLRPASARCLHVSVHTFTPVLRARRRDVDIGLLFDPARKFEAAVAGAWERQLKAALPRLRIRRNRPYRGTDDGLTTHLRTRFPAARYAGLELEVSQRFSRRGGRSWAAIQDGITASLHAALIGLESGIRPTGREGRTR